MSERGNERGEKRGGGDSASKEKRKMREMNRKRQ
jgi:hypothetical protein